MDQASVEVMTTADDKGRWWPAARRKIIRKILKEKLAGRRADILEVGCGPGWNLAMLSEFGDVTAMEPERRFFEFARSQNPGIPILHAAIPDQIGTKFDLILLLDVLEHISAFPI